MNKNWTESLLYSTPFRLSVIVLSFVALAIARQFVGAFGFSLGYLYVVVISLSGFWFGAVGGVAAALAASAIFYTEIILHPDFIASNLIVRGFIIRIGVYFVAGIVMGYLSAFAEKKNGEIEALNRARGELLGIVSHDLRNPLQSIILNIETLAEDDISSDKRKRTADLVSRESTFILSLINDILDIRKIESGKISIQKEIQDYEDCVTSNAERNRDIAKGRRITIRLDIAGPIPRLAFDRNRIDQLLNNLIGNAIKYSPPDGMVEIRVSQTGEGVLTEVSDSGPGLDPSELKKIFTPFYRGRKQPKYVSGEKSTGLGLTIAASIVDAHGGRIWVESKPEKGARFYFILPL